MTVFRPAHFPSPLSTQPTSGWQLRGDFLATGLNDLELRQSGDRWQVARMEMTVCPWRLSLVLGTVGEGLPPVFSPLVGSGYTCSSTSLARKAQHDPSPHPIAG